MTNYSPPSDSIKTLKARRSRTMGRMTSLMDTVNAGRRLTPGEHDEYQRLERDLRDIDATVKIRKDGAKRVKDSKGYAGDSRTEGRVGELLKPDQSVATWAQRAAANGVGCGSFGVTLSRGFRVVRDLMSGPLVSVRV
jgi:hypothetical protein